MFYNYLVLNFDVCNVFCINIYVVNIYNVINVCVIVLYQYQSMKDLIILENYGFNLSINNHISI